MIFGDRIKQARVILGENQQEFCSRLGIHQSRLSELENGTWQPPETIVMAIAERTGFPPEFFEREPQARIDDIQFRARVKVKAADRNRVIEFAQLIHESYEVMRREVNAPTVRIQRFDGDPERSAQEMRFLLGLDPNGPIRNLTLSLERCGVVVLALPAAGPRHDAFSWWHRGARRSYPVIATLADASGDRLRWNLAHELGHLALHGGMMSREIEQEADLFAAALLTPLLSLRREMPQKPTLSSLYAMKARWGVSVQSLIRRAKVLGLLDDHQYMSMFRQVSARGERMNERIKIVREKPRAYRKMAEVLFGLVPSPGLAKCMNWTEDFSVSVVDQFATQSELTTRRELAIPRSGLAEVVPLRSLRPSATKQRF